MPASASSSNPLRRYLHGSGNDASWAIVTGSTNGMGEEFAHQLAGLGFNVILHGRNAAKLASVQAAITSKHTSTQVRTVAIDAGANLPDLTPLLKLLAEVRVTVLVNNVGVVSQDYPLLEDERPVDIAMQITTNTVFPTILASQALPSLKKNTPSLMINMASLGAWAPTPFLSPYGGAKAYMLNFSRSLYNEMACENAQVDVVCLAPGQVVSGMNEGPPTAMMPTSEAWVRKALSSLAPGLFSKRPGPVIVPWTAHAWAARAMAWMPRSTSDSTVSSVTMDLKKKKQQSKGTKTEKDTAGKEDLCSPKSVSDQGNAHKEAPVHSASVPETQTAAVNGSTGTGESERTVGETTPSQITA